MFLFFISCNEEKGKNVADSVMDTMEQAGFPLADSIAKPSPDTTSYGKEIYKDYIPEKIFVFIEENLNGWSIPAPSCWENYWFNKYKANETLVNFFSADFDCDGGEDYAMILYNEIEEQLGIWVISSDSSGYKADRIEVFEQVSKGYPLSYGISIATEGRIADMYNGKSILMECPGINMEFFEAASRIYYYSDGKFKYVQTGD